MNIFKFLSAKDNSNLNYMLVIFSILMCVPLSFAQGIDRFNLLEAAYLEEGDREIAKPWIETPLNLNKVKENSGKIIVIFSDNDSYVSLSNKEIFKEKLNAEIIIEHEKGHFGGEDGIIEFLAGSSERASFGKLYSNVTLGLGFKKLSGEGKTMGLAAYGDPEKFYDKIDEVLKVRNFDKLNINV